MSDQHHNLDSEMSYDQFQLVSNELMLLAKKLRVTGLLLVNSSGRILAHRIDDQIKHVDVSVLSTLIAGEYSASKEIADVLGEKNHYKMVLHEGDGYNVFVSTVVGDLFLIVIFKSGVALGMVRLLTRRTIDQLKPILIKKESQQKQSRSIISSDFQSMLDEELERAFNE